MRGRIFELRLTSRASHARAITLARGLGARVGAVVAVAARMHDDDIRDALRTLNTSALVPSRGF